ncbi:lipid-A-disaccharide synthase-related protein [Microcystis aeruginosa CS-564/01]|uniref:lipid-A-disaccharide synthase-related protein n=1 Tax=Microcystis aeruginosa TaxID=1126 RepID=UPI0023305473|nr:lipid-A-disaccharide synthase-related protein [Microcystis aeruginosa]MDB9423488.1 lipid-A-disaccharide synthase-related protein [Microcystis aeruginosa CS-564/01]
MLKQVLFLSNGHGEDLNASLIVGELQKIQPQLSIAALPLVGEGKAYQKLPVPIIAPTATMPSGGIIYTNPFNWIKDIGAGLIGLTIKQIQAAFKVSKNCDLLIAVGDIVPIAIARLTGRPFVAFIVSTSSYYEGTIKLPLLTKLCLRSDKCLRVFTRDKYTATDLQNRGIKKAIFAGYPIMDVLTPTGKDLELDSQIPMIALLAGSRLPEALSNLALQLQVCEEIVKIKPMQFRAAIIPSIRETDLENLAKQEGWHYLGAGKLEKNGALLYCYRDAFADILHHCDACLAMAGTAVEQAVGLGKPVLQIPGFGPQFTYPFAEAQMRLLGESVITIGKKPTEVNLFKNAAVKIVDILADSRYLHRCLENGKIRVGESGGSRNIAEEIYMKLGC